MACIITGVQVIVESNLQHAPKALKTFLSLKPVIPHLLIFTVEITKYQITMYKYVPYSVIYD